MGRCKCGVDTGWFNGKECSACYNKKQIHYQDRVEVTNGFYIGQKGIVVGKEIEVSALTGCFITYTLKLSNGDTIECFSGYVKKLDLED